MQTRPTLAVILAGGLGRRMGGAPKPLLTLGGRRLIDHVIDRARRQNLEVVVNLHDVTPEAAAPFGDAPCIADAIPGHAGPLAGILAALDHANGFNAVLSLPCDTPFLPDDLADRLTEAAGKTRDGLACAASGGRVHPVVALWPLSLRETLRRALVEEGIRGIGQFQRRYDCATVEWPAIPRDPFMNVNTPEELAAAEALLAPKILDLRGLKCPLPVLKTRKFLADMAPGERVEVSCTDPMSFVDVPHLLRETGDVLEAQNRAEGVAVFLIRREVR
ncbi:molybdopterin-guanine dinucleotide biosynthesis protein A [Rhodoblastus acidophilus]|uniref:molybdenum cofactor guanylyltransferase MobA n=1 Tax=Rhodoblastus acidophilus TaxID=1074 RepID=UPI0029CAC37D|nr:molybdenum cofactor guanylyltransferase MobA [Rhodoblastus acidophilus]MCW2283953.1 molybdopterin-guanine dinucleotide biosynthesis protein A [Rhodoblastus acidophilus]MCW2332649.1 molybdopterin-guanine dinucleotide biosynthesis protein A [Rhodoblastus acidophilus]